ncbi:TonB C-terminal domain-containing protein [Bradyrhizobium sp. LHD-71]|uniref:TonB C-terminal domain-containing protein n=1 Tax=Bradyrhizobium sp. LHD-71 TaxID=3072141 RepID=UPI00280FF9FB|nr:TonB C-terminal domain-containing protein [Bradyrhizobium sp. LHD-71]MDQ8728089.1 TonB C-terminal domain-containing protein [Bradyrhizobium sp. LHD-71]
MRAADRRRRDNPDFKLAPGDQDMEQEASALRRFARRYGAATGAGVGGVALVAVLVIFFVIGDDAPPPRKVQDFTIVNVVPPPPPPPPPPPEQKLPEPEMIEQQPITEPEIKEEAKVEEPKDAPPDAPSDEPPPGPLGLDQAAEGPGDNFNLAGRPGGRGLLGGGGGGGSKWGYYAAMVQQQIEAAVRAHPKTRNSVARVEVRLWADATGRVTRVQIVSSTADAEIDAVIRGEVLASLALRDRPPSDMPMPIVTRITLRRPS